MTPDENEAQQGVAASPLTLLDTKRITVLTDAAMHLFGTLADVEREAKRVAKARLAAEMNRLDLFGLTANKAGGSAEEYQPQDKRGWCQ